MAADKELKYKLTLQDVFTSKMKGAVDSTKQMDGAMSGLGSKIAGVAAGLGLGALTKQMVQTGAQFDSYKARLETMLGSQAKAAKVFDQIKQDAAKTPFDVASLTEANAMLIGAGADAKDARDMVMGLGNAIAATGGSSVELSRMAVNLQQIKTLGKASAMDIKQFAFAGIPIYQVLAKTTGKSVEQLKEMDITYEQLKTAFAAAAKEGGMFAGGLEKQSKTIGGQLSNLGDQFTNTLVSFYDRLKPAITTIIGYLSKMLSWVDKNKETIIMFGKFALLIGGIVTAVKAWSAATLVMESAQLALNVAMTANPVGAVIVAVTALIGTLAILIQQYKTVQELHQSSLQEKSTKAYDDETKQIDFLIERYEKLGYSKELAQKKGLAAAKENLAYEYSALKSQLANASTDEEKRIAEKRLYDLGGRNKAISEYGSGGLGGASSSGSKAGGGSSSSSVGSSTDISSARPQSLIININDGLVKQMNVYATNIKESADKIREEVAKALLETANDANLAAR